MAATLRSYTKRAFEERLVAAVPCLDCDAPRGQRCTGAHGRERVVCCGARAYFGEPVLIEQHRMRVLLAEFGLLSLDGTPVRIERSR